MSLLVTGSLGIDTVETPAGKAENVMGGSGVYFAFAASFFTPVRLVGVVGEDCPDEFLYILKENPNIDTSGIEVRKGAKTFRWHGKYHDDLNQRDTIAVELNVLAESGPNIPEKFRDSKFVFLANTHPELQLGLLSQLNSSTAAPHSSKLIVADTMDLWISTQREKLMALLERLDGLVLNDAEARLLTEESNLVFAGKQIAQHVQRFVIIKKGEHGSLLFVDDEVFPIPAWPAVDIIDPTGAGDSFAGAMMGYLAQTKNLNTENLKKAAAYGTVTASFTLEDFSLNRLRQITREQIDERMKRFEQILQI